MTRFEKIPRVHFTHWEVFLYEQKGKTKKDRGIVDIAGESRKENVSSQGTDERGKVKVDWLYC